MSDDITWEQAKESIRKFNEAVAPVERAFMDQVQVFRDIGYGRMRQLIQERWYLELARTTPEEPAR